MNLFHNGILRHFMPGVVICVSVWLAGCHSKSKDWAVEIGDALPAFSLKDINGEAAVSPESLAGKPYVLTVFATWCPPCHDELTALNQMVWEKLSDKGVKVIAVNWGDEDESVIRNFAETNGFKFPILLDSDGTLRKQLGVSMIPQSLVVDSTGKIIDLHVGVTEEIVSSIAEELAEQVE